MDIEQTGCYRSMCVCSFNSAVYVKFRFGSGVRECLLNKSLDVLFFTVAAVVGYGVLLLFEKF